MKTVEEMRDDVLAECEWICPNRDFPANADWGHLMFGYVKYDGDDYEAWFLYVSASIHPISLYARSADQIWIAAYSLLGLSDAETHRIQIEVKDEKMAALEAKNAALVDRIELALSLSEDSDINRILGNALAANEKGGKGE